MKLVLTSTCASPGLVGLARTRTINVLGGRGHKIKRVSACLSGNNKCGRIVFSQLRIKRSFILFINERLTIGRSRAMIKGLLLARVLNVLRGENRITLQLLGNKTGSVYLPTQVGLLLCRIMNSSTLYKDCSLYASFGPTLKRLIGMKSVGLTMGRRDRNTKGKNYTRCGLIEVIALNKGPYPLLGARTILFINSGGTRVFRLNKVLGRHINTSCRVVLPYPSFVSRNNLFLNNR